MSLCRYFLVSFCFFFVYAMGTLTLLLLTDRLEFLPVNLRILDVSFNKIANIEGLDNLGSLETLLLSHNEIRRLEGIYFVLLLLFCVFAFEYLNIVDFILSHDLCLCVCRPQVASEVKSSGLQLQPYQGLVLLLHLSLSLKQQSDPSSL